jgi:dihydropyrimidinase
MYDLLVRGGTVVTPAGVHELDVAVRGERIAALGEPGSFSEAARTIEARGLLVLPGGVDPHCHYSILVAGAVCETQEFSHAAAAGGTTTLVDFVFHEAKAEPYMTPEEAIQRKQDEAAGSMAVDYGLHFIFTQNPSYEDIAKTGDIIRAGLPTIKVMTTYGWMNDDGHVYGIMSEVARNGGMTITHAEDDAIANWLTAKYVREGKTHGGYVSEVRPALVEEAAIRRLMLLAERTGSSLYILHMGAGSGVRALAEGRARGLRFYGETLPPFLSVTQDVLFDEERGGLLWNNYPTIKTQADQDELWRALADGRLDTVGSDHSGWTVHQRNVVHGTTIDGVLQAGQSDVELRVPVVYSLGVSEGRISLERFVEVISANPAKLMGLWPQKGQIAVGSDADIVILDPNRRWTVHHEDLHQSSDYCCWEDWELTGRVMTTILRGSVLYEEGNWVGSRTNGRFIERRLLPEHASIGAQPEAAGPLAETLSMARA